MPLSRDVDKKAVAAHLVTIADNALGNAADTVAKMFDDARDAGCLKEFVDALQERDIVDDVKHFLGPDRVREIGL